MADLNLPFITKKHNPWVNSFTMDQLKRFSPKIMYDIGCGDGYYGKLIKHIFPNTHVTGIDVNPKWTNYCKHLSEYDRVVLADIKEIAYLLKGDGVIAGDVLEHLEEKDMEYVLEQLVINFEWVIVNSPLNFHFQPNYETWEIHRCGINKETYKSYNVLEFNVKEEETLGSLPMLNVLIQGKKN